MIGNLIDLAESGEFDVIVHGCNCFCNMGAGIAKEIKRRYPIAYEFDCSTRKGDRSKLGAYTWGKVTSPGGQSFIIVNAYTQYAYGRGMNVDYDAIRSVFSLLKTYYGTLRIGYPLIGAGLGGGDWKVISGIINQELFGVNHSLVTLEAK